MSGLLGAVAFLTRVPVRHHPSTPEALARSVPWFPVVGFGVGVVAAMVYAALLPLLTPLLAALLALAVQLLVTGGFHEDGLGDLADTAGGWSVADRLRILEDPRHGTFGVLAIVVVTVLRVGSISALDAWQALAALPAAHALGRGAAVALMGAVPPALGEGLGAGYVRQLRGPQVVTGACAAVALATVAVGPWAAAGAGLAAAGAVAVGAYARRTLGGLNGDVLGAAQQVGELAVLLLAVAVATNGWAPLAWWH